MKIMKGMKDMKENNDIKERLFFMTFTPFMFFMSAFDLQLNCGSMSQIGPHLTGIIVPCRPTRSPSP